MPKTKNLTQQNRRRRKRGLEPIRDIIPRAIISGLHSSGRVTHRKNLVGIDRSNGFGPWPEVF